MHRLTSPAQLSGQDSASSTCSHLDDGGRALADLQHRLSHCTHAARLPAHLAAPHLGDAHVEHAPNKVAARPAQAAEVAQHVLGELQRAIRNACAASRPRSQPQMHSGTVLRLGPAELQEPGCRACTQGQESVWAKKFAGKEIAGKKLCFPKKKSAGKDMCWKRKLLSKKLLARMCSQKRNAGKKFSWQRMQPKHLLADTCTACMLEELAHPTGLQTCTHSQLAAYAGLPRSRARTSHRADLTADLDSRHVEQCTHPWIRPGGDWGDNPPACTPNG